MRFINCVDCRNGGLMSHTTNTSVAGYICHCEAGDMLRYIPRKRMAGRVPRHHEARRRVKQMQARPDTPDVTFADLGVAGLDLI